MLPSGDNWNDIHFVSISASDEMDRSENQPFAKDVATFHEY